MEVGTRNISNKSSLSLRPAPEWISTIMEQEAIEAQEGSSSSSRVFSLLKSSCLELLHLLQNPKNHSPALSHLLDLLRSSPPQALQPLFDYISFPLLLLLDAAVSCRSFLKLDFEEAVTSHVNGTQNKVSDAVAEGVLQCLEELLRKCHLSSVNQMAAVLKKLAHGAMLSPAEAAEEFREGVVRCFKALLLNLTPCSESSCSCRQSLDRPPLLDKSYAKSIPATQLEHHFQPNECLLAFLLSESASAAVGHWLSLLLNISEMEGKRGLRGSAKLRIEALLTLRVLVAKVGTPDALAFFLPGVVSQLAKVLHVSKSMISGAAGNTEATDHAIRGLAEILLVVLQDDANICGAHVSLESVAGLNSHRNEPVESFLEELRQLHVKTQNHRQMPADDSSIKEVTAMLDLGEMQSPNAGGKIGPLYVKRTPDWIEKTSANVDKLLDKTFPHLCLHPAKRVRRGLLSAIQGLLLKCSHILHGSRLMLLECLCILVCDDSEEVSMAAQEILEFLFSLSEKHTIEGDVAEIFKRLLEKLPRMVLGSEESQALAHAQQMLAIIYYSGPQLVLNQLLRSPIKAARLFDVFAVCLSQESVFAGSLGKLFLSRPPSTGYLHSLAELRAGNVIAIGEQGSIRANTSEVPNMRTLVKELHYPKEHVYGDYEVPHMPPWFVNIGSEKLYQALAGILRLVGLSLIADCRSDLSLLQVVEIPLGYLRKLVSEIRLKEYNKESWESWYTRNRSGQLLRQASTAACIVNEILFGLSDQGIDILRQMFHKSGGEVGKKLNGDASAFIQTYQVGCNVPDKSPWEVSQGQCVRQHVIECVGTILHEYETPEVWDLPVDHETSLLQSEGKAEDIKLQFFRDVAMLHQVLIDGIGIFNLCLRKDFVESGFLSSSLYLLLENLICSNFEVRHASDAVLRVISATSGYPTVGHLVVANSDYVIESLCHQLRHLDLNPHVPNVLAAMLSYVGAAHKILPLLEEPMRSVSMELEILGKHQHPALTIPFLKAVVEIVKAAKHEACQLPAQAESYLAHVNDKVCGVKKKVVKDDMISGERDEDLTCYSDLSVIMEEWESILFKLNDNKRYRRIVASVAASCLKAATPLLASEKEPVCLIALQIAEDGINTLAKVEEAFRHEKETKEAIEEVASLCSFYHLKDIVEAADEGTDENRLLPEMNKLWPFLVACARNRIPVPVRRCLQVISSVVKTCGGDFFSRRFHNDGSHFWKLLSTSPFRQKPFMKDEKAALLLPYRSTSRTMEDPVSEASSLKIQAAVLHMIADLSQDKRSASAFQVVLKKVSGLVVGITCSGVTGLRDASIDALLGLASIDPDLIWLLVADVYYTMTDSDFSPSNSEFPEIGQILPPPVSSKDYLYVQYGGQTHGFDVNLSSVETVFKKLYPEISSLDGKN